MSWLEVLRDTYDACVDAPQFATQPLEPISHTTQQAQIEITISEKGAFIRASVIGKGDSATLVPCTEGSVGRSGSQPVHHPLCDKLQYMAGDFIEFGGVVTVGFMKEPTAPHKAYLADLYAWATSKNGHPKVAAIYAYVSKGSVMADLVKAGVLPKEPTGGQVLAQWDGAREQMPDIFKVIQKNQGPTDAFVRWRVEAPDDVVSGTWEDKSLQEAWIKRYATLGSRWGLCQVTGLDTALATQHPGKLRHGADKAKLISSNDGSGYTYRGRFLTDAQACGVGYESTQKAHNALRWLIERQGQRIGGNGIVVAWAKAGKPIPDPLANTLGLLGIDLGDQAAMATIGDVGQTYATHLNRAMMGYRATLDPRDDVVVMALDAATPGRSSITYYRELHASEFLERIASWHSMVAWTQNFGKDKRFEGAPSPRDIAEAAYGMRIDERLRKATIERLLPCIVDGAPLPRDLVVSVFRRVCNRVGLEHWEWERCLGIACGLIKGYEKQRSYDMALEDDRVERDYLFGRLLALAEHVEGSALHVANEKRDTNAARLMQRFADRPSSTWRTIELSLPPYWSRLNANKPGLGYKLRTTLDDVINKFAVEDFVSDRPLSSGFLIGYHCQRKCLWNHQSPASDAAASEAQ